RPRRGREPGPSAAGPSAGRSARSDDSPGIFHDLLVQSLQPCQPRTVEGPTCQINQAGAPGVTALRPLWPRNVRVGENSPSLCPTMSSCTNTRRNLLPLWTSNVWPTNSGMIVQARAQVLMGCLARFSFSLETLRYSFSSTYGPF